MPSVCNAAIKAKAGFFEVSKILNIFSFVLHLFVLDMILFFSSFGCFEYKYTMQGKKQKTTIVGECEPEVLTCTGAKSDNPAGDMQMSINGDTNELCVLTNCSQGLLPSANILCPISEGVIGCLWERRYFKLPVLLFPKS